MNQELTETNWEENFQKVIDNCVNKADQLDKIACQPDEILEDYKKYSRDARKKKKEYQSKSFKESKRSIGEDLSFFQQQCNAYFNPLKEKIQKACGNGLRFFKKHSLSIYLGLIGLIFVIVGTVISNNSMKTLFLIFGSILLLLVIANIIFKFY